MTELEIKLKDVVEKISSRLKEGPMIEEEYKQFLFDQLKEKGLVNGDYLMQDKTSEKEINLKEFDLNIKYVDEISGLLEEKLKIQLRPGLNQDYIILGETPLKEAGGEVKKDFTTFEEAVQKTTIYLKNRMAEMVDNKSTDPVIKVDNILREYIKKEFSHLETRRMAAIKTVATDLSYHHYKDIKELNYRPSNWEIRLTFEELRGDYQTPGLEEVKETLRRIEI